jgi:hypothetical protein
MSLDDTEFLTPVRRSNFGGKPGVKPTVPQPNPLDVASPSPVSNFGGKPGVKPPVLPDIQPANGTAPVTPVPKLPAPVTVTPMPKPTGPAPTTPPAPVSQTPLPTAPTGAQAPATPGSLGLDFMRQVTPNELVENRLNGLLSSDSAYIRNARLRGAEYAASRGNINSSIGAGASQRAALEAAMPIAESDAGVYRDANRANFESLSQLRQMRTAADLDNWLSSENFTRDFNGRLATMSIQSSQDMLTYITQRALEDPAVYTPDVISGFNNFFNLNMKDMFRNFYGPTNTGGGG